MFEFLATDKQTITDDADRRSSGAIARPSITTAQHLAEGTLRKEAPYKLSNACLLLV